MKQNLAERLESTGGEVETYRGAIAIRFERISDALRAFAKVGGAISWEIKAAGDVESAKQLREEWDDLLRVGVVYTAEGVLATAVVVS